MNCVYCEKNEARAHGYPLCVECESDRVLAWQRIESATQAVAEQCEQAESVRETLGPVPSECFGSAVPPVIAGGFDWYATREYGWETNAENVARRLAAAYAVDFRPDLIH